MTTAAAEAFRTQAGWCERLGSPLYASLLATAADDIDAGGPVAALIDGWRGDPLEGALALRVMGAVHAETLNGDAPRLAQHYPSSGGTPRWPGVTIAFLDVVAHRRQSLRPVLDRPVQTNEVNRCAVLLAGLVALHRWRQLPIRLLELGSSAGLNLNFDRYRYDLGGQDWGDPDSPVEIVTSWRGAAPRLPAVLPVVARRGCDPNALDVNTEAGRIRIMSYIWPDQAERWGRLRSALQVAASRPPPLDRMGAAEWLPRHLRLEEDVLTVVFHSVVWQYMTDLERQQVTERITTCAARATPTAPLAWLNMEPAAGRMELRSTTWPVGDQRLVADVQAHGARVSWM